MRLEGFLHLIAAFSEEICCGSSHESLLLIIAQFALRRGEGTLFG